MAEAERILSQLRDVQAASITTDGDEIREIHIVAVSNRAPKQIVRDVETALNAYLKRHVDHRVISVALSQANPTGVRHLPPILAVPPVSPPAGSAVAPAHEPASPVYEVGPPAANPTPGPGRQGGRAETSAARNAPRNAGLHSPATRRAEEERQGPVPDRVRFVSANLFASGLRTQAQVELSWQGQTRLGNATGASSRDNAHRLVSAATLQALGPYLGEECALAPHEVELVRLGRQEVVVVTVKLLAQRSEKTLVGACTVEQDVAQSVVYATLAAVNRVLGGLRAKEPVEYELRPTST